MGLFLLVAPSGAASLGLFIALLPFLVEPGALASPLGELTFRRLFVDITDRQRRRSLQQGAFVLLPAQERDGLLPLCLFAFSMALLPIGLDLLVTGAQG